MAFEFKLADLGEGVQEGEIVRWLVSEGDVVEPEQHLVEVMTDKVTAELPSPVGGTVTQLNGKPGDIVQVGETLVVIEQEAAPSLPPSENGGGSPPSAAEAEAVTEALAEPPSKVAAGVAALAVPSVRRLARELGVDLRAISGTGPGGRILEADVRSAANPAADASAQPSPTETIQRIPLRGVRRAIAEHLVHSHRETAPYTYVDEADFTELISIRDRVQPMAEGAGVRLTYLPLILAALSMALREHPTLNATVDAENGDLLVQTEQHVSVAVHTDEGLVVPVLRNLEQRKLLDVARELDRLTQGARAGKLSREEMTGGTFSVTSLGTLGGLFGTPMLHTPQVAILGIHKIAPRPVVRDGVVVARDMANLSLTLDHRYIDGHVGASFAQTLKQYLEDPALTLFWLAELKNQ